MFVSSPLGQIHDVIEVLAKGPDAIANLTALPAGARVAAHTHANAYLQLHVLGGYRECNDGGETLIDGPSAVFFPAGSAHEMEVASSGLATVLVEFNENWLADALGDLPAPTRVTRWVGGEVGAWAERLARLWLRAGPQPRRLAMTADLLGAALRAPMPPPSAPRWIDHVEAAIEGGPASVDRLARRLGVSQAWLSRAYRTWKGEGLGRTLRRRRVGAAAQMLAAADLGLAEVAAAAGFCDQSHMNRAFRTVVGRTPAQVRSLGLRPTSAAAQTS